MSIPFRRGPTVWRRLLLLALLCVTACTPDHPSEPPLSAPTAGARCVFLAVGRQGYGDAATRSIAISMERIASERRSVNFTLLMGDNFYPAGVSSARDPQWDSKFESLYDGAYLRGMPFFAIAGNHDHQGSIKAQLDYSHLQAGSGRWQMDAPYYARDFGSSHGRPLVRIVFLDSVSLLGIGTDDGILPPSRITRDEQLRFLKAQFAADGVQPYWKIVASHYPSRSLTENGYSERRVMNGLLPVLVELGVDLHLSANDRFQQVIDIAGEPLQVAVNGGAPKLDKLPALDTPSQLVAPQRGFALISSDEGHLKIEMFDENGWLSHTRSRQR